jgi:putative transposase
MKKSKFSDSQVMDALKRVESGLSVPDLCRDLGISSATFYTWRAKYGGLDAPIMSRMKELELENARLKKMYAEERLKAEILKEAMAKKWWGHRADARWPNDRFSNGRFRSEVPATCSRSVRPAIDTKPSTMPRTHRLPIG